MICIFTDVYKVRTTQLSKEKTILMFCECFAAISCIPNDLYFKLRKLRYFLLYIAHQNVLRMENVSSRYANVLPQQELFACFGNYLHCFGTANIELPWRHLKTLEGFQNWRTWYSQSQWTFSAAHENAYMRHIKPFAVLKQVLFTCIPLVNDHL